MRYAAQQGLPSRIHLLHKVAYHDLPALYKRAEAMVYPSYFEGFGIPIVEALSAGVPVIASTGSCLEEAGGEHSIYVDPDDVEGMANAMKKVLFFFFFLTAWSLYSEAQVANEDKLRLIVTTDLGGTDPDDIQSMIHLLLCSNAIDIEGLISSQVWMDDPDKTAKISEVVEQFGEVLPRLNKHAEGYPSLNQLRAIIKRGQPSSNMTGVGQGKDSPGSELIISVDDKI